jgi:hypothetical protein
MRPALHVLPARLALLALLAALGACRHDVVVPRLGFIPPQVETRTEPGDAATQTYVFPPDLEAVPTTDIVVLPTVLYPEVIEVLTPEEAETLRTLLTEALVSALGPRARASTGEPIGGAFVVHAAITELKPNNPLLNVAPQSQIRGRGYGYASVEIYLRRGEYGPVAAAYANTMDTQRFSLEKLSRTGTAEQAAKTWGERFAALVRGK